jgi:hypothetical protein
MTKSGSNPFGDLNMEWGGYSYGISVTNTFVESENTNIGLERQIFPVNRFVVNIEIERINIAP